MSTQEMMSSMRPKSLRAQKLKEAKEAREEQEEQEEQEAYEEQKVKSVLRAKRLKECKLIREAKKVQEAKEAKLAAEQEAIEAKLAAEQEAIEAKLAAEQYLADTEEGYVSSYEDKESRSVRTAALFTKRREKAKAANIALRAKRGMELEGDYSSDDSDEESRAVKRGVDFFISAMLKPAGGKRQLRIDHLSKKADMIKASKKKSPRARSDAEWRSRSQSSDLDMSDYESYYYDSCDTDEFGSISDDEYYSEIYDRLMERQRRKEKGEGWGEGMWGYR
jgi:hypothetical protein